MNLTRALLGLTAILLMAGTAAPARAVTSITPAGDDMVVERLGAASGKAWRERHRAMVARADPSTAAAAAAAADALQRARRSGDPRDLGEAQAALGAWWSHPAPPPDVRLMRATILQSLHRFDDAMADLDALLRPAASALAASPQAATNDQAATRPTSRPLSSDVSASSAPTDTSPIASTSVRRQTRLVRAALHQVQGRLNEARADCEALATELRSSGSRTTPHQRAAQACLAELRSLQGDPNGAERALAALHAGDPEDAWLALLRAELALRTDRPLDAVRLLEPFTSSAGAEIYAIATHADALLQAGRADAALALLDRRAPTDVALPEALQLRRAITRARLRHADARGDAAALRRSLDSARQRGDTPHLREEAWLALDVEGDAARAWRLATDNWRTQKEPIDALLFVRSAMAAGQGSQARGFVEQRRAEGWHDLRLARALEASR
jgi:hypothetical protein